MKQCPKCQANISDTAKFCMECGCNIKKYEEEQAQPKARFCPECGTEIPRGSFCPECGYDIGKEQSAAAEPSVTDTFGDAWLSDIESSTSADMVNLKAQRSKMDMEQALAAFEYEEHTDGTYTITGLKDKTLLKVMIPEGVEAIGDRVFEGSEIISAELPEGLLKIGNRSFANCAFLNRILLPDSLMFVGNEAFADCSLLDIVLPASVRNVGNDAMKNTLLELKQQAEAEEARKKTEAEAARKAEEECKKAEAEAARKAEEERKKAEAEAARKAEEERKKAEAEATRKEEEAKHRYWEECRQKAAPIIQKAKEARLEKEQQNLKTLYRREGDTVCLGWYPQSLKEKNVVVYDETNAKGWHKGSDGAFYHLADGAYYKVEPIRWHVLYENDSECKLISEDILDCTARKYWANALKSFADIAFDQLTLLAYMDYKNETLVGFTEKWNKDLIQSGTVSLLPLLELEHIEKKRRHKKPTDFSKRKQDTRPWLLIDPTNNSTHYMKQWASPKNDYYGLVPCIKIKKNVTLELDDMYYMRVNHHNVYDPNVLLKVTDYMVSLGEMVKKGDPLLRYEWTNYCTGYSSWHRSGRSGYEIMRANADGTVASMAKIGEEMPIDACLAYLI